MRKLLCGLLLVSGCGNERLPWTEWQPIVLHIQTEYLPAPSALRALTEGLAQFGLSTTAQDGPGIYVLSAAAALCSAKTFAVVQSNAQDTIHVCARTAELARVNGIESSADTVLKHELGHVLGLMRHLPEQPGVLMAAEHINVPSPRVFGPLDIEAICSAGRVQSKVCR